MAKNTQHRNPEVEDAVVAAKVRELANEYKNAANVRGTSAAAEDLIDLFRMYWDN